MIVGENHTPMLKFPLRERVCFWLRFAARRRRGERNLRHNNGPLFAQFVERMNAVRNIGGFERIADK